MKKVALQTDPVLSLNIEGDSTLALGLEAQLRGFELWSYQPKNLFVLEGEVFALAQKTFLRDEVGSHATLEPPQKIKLTSLDYILMRQDPPFNMDYITATYFLDLVKDKVMVINNPTWVRSSPEKILPLYFNDLQPKTLIATSLEEIKLFRDSLSGAMILKPLYGNGGKGIALIEKKDKNLEVLVETMTLAFEGAPLIAQEFIERVVEGDKRIILLNGNPVACLNRVPAKGDIRANLGAGASGHLDKLTAREEEICAALAPVLRAQGIYFAGIDVIAGLLTEINITSPTGMWQIKNLGGVDVAKLFWDGVGAQLR